MMFNMNIGTSFAAVQLDYHTFDAFRSKWWSTYQAGGESALQQNLSSSVTEGVKERAT